MTGSTDMTMPYAGSGRKAVVYTCILLITAVFYRFISGYYVFTNDHTQYLLLPFRHLFPAMCPDDWLVWKTSHYHYTFSYIIRGIYRLSAGHIELGIFALWGIFFTGFFHALYLMVTALKGGFKEYAIVIAMLTLYVNSCIGGTPTFSFQVVPSFMAFVTTLYALSFLLMHRYLPALAILGLATFFHVNYGVLGLPLFLTYIVLNFERPRLREYLLGTAAFTVIGLPSLVPAFANFGAKGHNDGLRYVYYVRSPHHYLPSAYPLKAWVTSIAPILLAFFCILRDGRNRRLLAFSGLALAFLAFFTVTTGFDGPYIFKKVYPFRFTPLFLIFSYAVIARFIMTVQGTDRLFTGSALAVLAISALVKDTMIYALTAHLVLAVFILLIRRTGTGTGRFSRTVPVTAFIILMLILTSGLARNTLLPGPAKKSIFYREDIMEAIKTHVPADALILSPPSISGIRLNTHRSIVINYPGVPMGNGSEMTEWVNRLERVTGTDLAALAAERSDRSLMYRLNDAYATQPPVRIRQTMQHFGADHFITFTDHAGLPAFGTSGFKLLYSDARFHIYSLDNSVTRQNMPVKR